MRFSPAKVSHLPCDTPPITHAHRMTFTEASYLLLSHKPRWWAIFCSAGASISFSLKLLSLFFFFFSLLLYFPRYCQAIFNLVNFSLFFLELFQKIFQSQCEMTLTGAAVAAYIVQFRISLLFIQVTGRGTKMLWQSPGTMRITLTLVVCFRCLIRCSENSFIKPKYTGYKLCKYNHKSLNMFSCCDSGIYIINLQQSKVDDGQALQESLVQNHPCRCFKRAIYSANNEAREMFSGYNLKSV